MKRLPLFFVACLLGDSLQAQIPAPAAPATQVGAPAVPLRTAAELEALLGPIALYPDALVALILPAATAPADIVLAARQLRDSGGDRSQVEHRAWDESVKSLTHYPEVLQWLDENLDWTKQVGEAFVQQPADVMQAMQRLRARARAAGTLADTPQQQVITEAEVIRIVPTQPDVIYVPRYAPEVVFVDSPGYYSSFARPFLTFGLGVSVGSWLAYDCDWRRNTIWVGSRHRPWVRHDWRRPVVPIAPLHPTHHYRPPAGVRPWSPSPHVRSTVIASSRPLPPVARPAPVGFRASPPPTLRPGSGAFVDRTRPGGRPPLPTTPSLPLAPGFAAPSPGDPMGPHADRRRTPSVAASPRPASPPVTMPNLQPLPSARRPAPSPGFTSPPPAPRVPIGGDDGRSHRSFRTGRDGRSGAGSLQTAPALPMAPGERPGPASGPFVGRSASRTPPPPPSAPPAAAPAGGESTPAPASSQAGRGNRGGWNRPRL